MHRLLPGQHTYLLGFEQGPGEWRGHELLDDSIKHEQQVHFSLSCVWKVLGGKYSSQDIFYIGNHVFLQVDLTFNT